MPYSAATAGLCGGVGHLLELRFEPALEHAVDAVEIDVDDRRDVERQQLRQAQAADHRDAERLAQLGALAGAERDRQRAEDRRERRHHDRAEAQQARFADRGLGDKPTRRRSSAKSIIMMAFFFTMPTSMTMPIMAITDRSMLEQASASAARRCPPTAGRK